MIFRIDIFTQVMRDAEPYGTSIPDFGGPPTHRQIEISPRRISSLESIAARSGCVLNLYRLETLATLKPIGRPALDTRGRRSSARGNRRYRYTTHRISPVNEGNTSGMPLK